MGLCAHHITGGLRDVHRRKVIGWRWHGESTGYGLPSGLRIGQGAATGNSPGRTALECQDNRRRQSARLQKPPTRKAPSLLFAGCFDSILRYLLSHLLIPAFDKGPSIARPAAAFQSLPDSTRTMATSISLPYFRMEYAKLAPHNKSPLLICCYFMAGISFNPYL